MHQGQLLIITTNNTSEIAIKWPQAAASSKCRAL